MIAAFDNARKANGYRFSRPPTFIGRRLSFSYFGLMRARRVSLSTLHAVIALFVRHNAACSIHFRQTPCAPEPSNVGALLAFDTQTKQSRPSTIFYRQAAELFKFPIHGEETASPLYPSMQILCCPCGAASPLRPHYASSAFDEKTKQSRSPTIYRRAAERIGIARGERSRARCAISSG